LTFEDESITTKSQIPITDEWVIVEKGIGNIYEAFIHPASMSYYLRSTTGKGTITLDSNRTSTLKEISLSPKGQNVIYYDQDKGNYYGLNTETKERSILTQGISDELCMYITREVAAKKTYPSGIIGWVREDIALINGTFDLWYLYMNGKTVPKNITNRKGEKSHIIFRVLSPNSPEDLNWNKTIELASFDIQTKDQGFYTFKLDENPVLSKISVSSYQYYPPYLVFYGTIPNTVFIKSSNSKKYLILREKPDSYPNYYTSEDLKTFIPLSDYQPQFKYNWLTSELHKFKDSSGIEYEGILYKPENFDSTKAYPILFQYYTKQSENLNQFPNPEPAGSSFSVPMAVSRGYLVFLIDINSIVGYPVESATRSVLTAVQHLSQFKWIDTSKMAISGHSLGGYETNCIVTQTGVFRAAISGSGTSELISTPNIIGKEVGSSWEWYYVYGPYNIGKRLADNPNLYIKNSPLLMAKNITTPLLLVHNTLDTAVPFEQSQQLFMTLRGLKKPVWWINYEKEGHIISIEENLKDYNTKVFEFLDYYLKNGKIPGWMENHN
jgi:dienelactone hydrolase